MGQSLVQISENLRDAVNKAQLIYAFNGVGKTRLSREFRLLVAPKNEDVEEETGIKVLYYNAFTEDLFYWDKDLDADQNRKLLISPNGFTNMVLEFLKDQGLDGNIVSNFQHFTNMEDYHTILKNMVIMLGKKCIRIWLRKRLVTFQTYLQKLKFNLTVFYIIC